MTLRPPLKRSMYFTEDHWHERDTRTLVLRLMLVILQTLEEIRDQHMAEGLREFPSRYDQLHHWACELKRAAIQTFGLDEDVAEWCVRILMGQMQDPAQIIPGVATLITLGSSVAYDEPPAGKCWDVLILRERDA